MSLYGVFDSTGTVLAGIVDTSDKEHFPNVVPDPGWALLDGITPQPQVGWTYANGAWAPSAQQQAASRAAQFAASIPTNLTQAQADAAAISSIQSGQPLTAAQLAAMTNHANGWVSLLQALQALYQSLPSG